jgi:hypothetical protein
MPIKYTCVITFHNTDQCVKTNTQTGVVSLINQYYECPLVSQDVIRSIIYKKRCDATRDKFNRLLQIEKNKDSLKISNQITNFKNLKSDPVDLF